MTDTTARPITRAELLAIRARAQALRYESTWNARVDVLDLLAHVTAMEATLREYVGVQCSCMKCIDARALLSAGDAAQEE